MSLKHALLGFINYGPMTGYELKKFFDSSVAHFWNAELSQIYPALKNMEADGLVEMSVDIQEDRPNRKVYSITDRGREELLDWLAQPAEPEQTREPVLIKVFFGASLPKEQLLQVLRDRAERARRFIGYLEYGCAHMVKFAEAIGLEGDAALWGLTVDAGLRVSRAELEWAEAAIQTIERLDDSSFEHRHAYSEHFDIRTVNQVVERMMAAMPELSASTGAHAASTETTSNGQRTGRKAAQKEETR